jgi:hypothetical protein
MADAQPSGTGEGARTRRNRKRLRDQKPAATKGAVTASGWPASGEGVAMPTGISRKHATIAAVAS